MSWDTIKSGYDPDAFYVSGTDDKGHGHVVSAQVPPDIAAQVGYLAESSQFPAYRNKSDVVRDAVVHLLVKRATESDDHDHHRRTKLLIQRANAENLQREITDTKELIASLRKAMFAAHQAGDHETLRKALFQAEDAKLLLDPPYDDELGRIVAEYRALLEGNGQGANGQGGSP